MDEKRVKELIKIGRDFMKKEMGEEDDFISDQEKKLPQPPLVRAAKSEIQISLPTHFEDLHVEKDFLQIVNSRKSSRIFTKESLSLLELSYLLWVSQGVKEIRGKSYATIRTVPSGGARHGFETNLLVLNVEGLQPGKYHYLPMSHSLEYFGDINHKEEKISESVSGQSWASKAAVMFYYSFVPYRCEWRYGIYAHRPALMDVGHVGQNLYLACSALEIGTCALAAFNPSVCNALFDLAGEEEFVVYVFPVGKISKKDKEKEDAFYAFVKEEGL